MSAPYIGFTATVTLTPEQKEIVAKTGKVSIAVKLTTEFQCGKVTKYSVAGYAVPEDLAAKAGVLELEEARTEIKPEAG